MVLAAKTDTTVPNAILLLRDMVVEPKYSDWPWKTVSHVKKKNPTMFFTKGVAVSVSVQLVMLTIFKIRSGLLSGPS